MWASEKGKESNLTLSLQCLHLMHAAGLPTCQSLEFLGSLMEGQCLSFVATYSGGYDLFAFFHLPLSSTLTALNSCCN